MARTLRVNIIGDATGVNAAFASVSAQAQIMAAKVQTAMAGVSTGAILGVAGAAVVGKELFDIGEQFDSAYDVIRTGTGKTGDDLEALQGSFRDVATRVPADFETIATAIADLNTRTGLAGQPLEDLATQFIELSRISDTDIAGNIEAVTRAFGDWEVEDQAGALDLLFRASQESGASVDDLASQVTQFGAPLRQFGFGFEESVAMMGSFEKAGVNTETVMSGLRQGFGRLVADGEDPKQAFFDLATSIGEFGLTVENQQDALDIFGSRSLSDMSEALNQGRFDFDAFTASISGGSDTILIAADSTNDFAEQWALFKNNVLVALEPLATRVFNGMGELMAALVPILQEDVIPAIDSIATIIEQLWPIAQPILEHMMTGFQLLGEALGLVAAIMEGDWSEAWDRIKAIFDTAWEAITAPILALADLIADLAPQIYDAVTGLFSDAANWLIDMGKDLANGLIDGFIGIIQDFNPLSYIPGADAVTGAVGGAVGAVGGFLGFADGGIVRARPGGTLGVIGEAGYDEAVIPLDGRYSFGSSITIGNVVLPGVTDADSFIRELQAWERRNGPLPFSTAA